MTKRTGRLPDDPSRPKLDLTRALAAADFSMVPATLENATAIRSLLKMLGNDRAGDCEAVRWANHRLLLTGAYPRSEVQTTQDMVWSVYETQNPRFDPNGGDQTGPGSDYDQGMSSDKLLDYLHKTGGPDGVKVIAYGKVDPTDVTAVERAIALFGGVWVDILVQPGNQTEFDEGKPWTNTGEQPEGGHAVLGTGYVPERRVLTWAQETTLADSFWSGVLNRYGHLVESVYVVIWPENATREFIASTSASILAEDFEALTGKPLVWPSTPTPAPTPAPTPQLDADAELRAALTKFLHRLAGVPAYLRKAAEDWLG